MKKVYCVACGKYEKIKNPKISYILQKALVLSIICSKTGCKNEQIFNTKKYGRRKNKSRI